MALTDIFKSIGHGWNEEVREFKSILRRIRLTADTSIIGANFRKFGPGMGAYDFDAFTQKAREFYNKSMDSKDPLFTIVKMPGNRLAIDYDGNIRGIFTYKGKPLAFFRPSYEQGGYMNKYAELEDFKRGKNVLFS